MRRSESEIDFDEPLQLQSALAHDKLSRRGFAEIAAVALREVSSSTGLVLTIEGAWGSGKTSTLAMIEALLAAGAKATSPPLIVHFNPWLLGEKDALLRHFLSRIADAIKLSDHSRDGTKVAKEIRAYAKVFDLVKLIPGAEPWASMIKSVVEATGNVTESMSEHETPDVEVYKKKVEGALRKLDRPIYVFIDDVDRLFPAEVFEMIRIIKAVGGLPRIGYVVAWDSAYVSGALEKLGVPFASSYLDKVVQVRMPLPNLSRLARRKLMDDALSALPPQALQQRFRNDEGRLGSLYYSGLRDLLDQPRDIARVFNAVRMMEPLLRDEIVFADILGLAALSVKAPVVFELLRKKPRLFVGFLPDDHGLLKKSEDVIKDGNDERRAAYEASGSENAARRVVHFLFPGVATAEDGLSLGDGSYVEGNISHPSKLAIALQLSLSGGDVSIKAARQYLQEPDLRASLEASLTEENCDEFIDLVGEVGESLRGEGITDLEALCLGLCRLIEQPLFVARARGVMRGFFRADDMALRAVGRLVRAVDGDAMPVIGQAIAEDRVALSCAAEILSRNYLAGRERYSDGILLPEEVKDNVIEAVLRNIENSIEDGNLFRRHSPGFVLWTVARVKGDGCAHLFELMRRSDPTLDQFALHYLGSTWDSKGVSYSMPRDGTLQIAFCPLDDFKAHAAERVRDPEVRNPVRAAWRSVVEGKSFYGVDGTESHR